MTSSRRIPLRSILVVSSLVVCCGCVGTGRLAPHADPASADATAAGGDRCPGCLRASFKGRLELGSDTQRFEGAVALESPDRLYVELTGPLGGVRAVMAASGERVIVLFPGTRQYIDEDATPSTYEALLGLRLQTAGLIDLIRLADGSGAGAEPRRLSLAPGADGIARHLIVSRDAGGIAARLE